MVTDLISLECCVELHDAKYYGEYDDHYASKIQAAYRMSTQKKLYAHKRQVHECAAQVLQALYRGVGARRRYSEMKVEREKNLFDGLRANLDHATANTKDPRSRARELSKEVERRRHVFLMQVLQGYVAENYVLDEFRVSAQLVREIYDEYGVVVGCSTNFGDVVASYLANDFDPAVCACVGDNPHASTPPRQFSNREVSAALLLGLEDQCDDTFGLSSKARRLTTGSQTWSKQMTLEADESTPPRRMLKTCLAFQQSNRNRLAALRLTRKAAGQKSAHLVARNFRDVLSASFDSFDSCRAAWETEIRVRHDQQRLLDMFSVDELVHH
ncbi:hypothetical protein BBJ28_00011074 [Nothophytophthora sp. Chile5]|nr:hypothetical protein BBJ28_00011074 [Nothophytophthora sp. Chile5]